MTITINMIMTIFMTTLMIMMMIQELFDREEVSSRTPSEAQIRHRFFNQQPQVKISSFDFGGKLFLRGSFGRVGPSGRPREGSA